MGWWGHYYGSKAPRGKERLAEILKEEGMDKPTEHGYVVDAAIVGTTAYVAYHHNESGKVIGYVMLSYFDKNGFLMVKTMYEFVGPGAHDCPKRIMDKLSEIGEADDPNGWAREWRRKCEESRNAKAKDRKEGLGSLPLGSVIQLRDKNKTVLSVVLYRNRRTYTDREYRYPARYVKRIGWDMV